MSQPPLEPGQCLHGFRIIGITPLPGLRAVAIRATHEGSGAQLLHVHSETDTENSLAITFPTPPPDDTGLPHIMEHAVLGGSRKFPVREPFFEMVKMSMATFINAMTAPAYTVYPIATNVKKDFFNLAEVYLDAVFHPELTEDTFRREGHHLSLADNSDLSSPLTVTGIVYNEMKGAYAAPESLMWAFAGRGLVPDTPIGHDYGGDPAHIPELTYARFLQFHREQYHPGNAQFFLYGDIPTAEHLRALAPVLAPFTRREAPLHAPRQPRWTTPRLCEHPYPVGTGEDTTARTFLTLNWLVGDALDPACAMAWDLLTRLLLGNEAAPLKKALIDAKLGTDVFFAGAWAGAYEQEFHIGLKGSEPDRASAFEALVLDTLARLADTPFAPAHVEAAFQQLAYDTLEVKTLFPLHVLDAVNNAWPFGADPLTFLRPGETLAACHARYQADPQFLNRLIREALLDNPHRLRVTLRPDGEAQPRTDAEFAAQMAARRATLSPAELATIATQAAALEAAQGAPNSPEALARLPQLHVRDLPDRPRHIPTTLTRVGGIEVLRNAVFTNGVNYVDLNLELSGLPADLYAWIPRYTDAMNKMGAGGQDYTAIAERRAACTGGLGCHATACRHALESGRTLHSVRLGMKTLDGQMEPALRLMGDLLFGVEAQDRERLRDVLTQAHTGLRTSLINDGLGTARRHAARGLSPESALDDLVSSPAALRRLEALVNDFDRQADVIIDRISRVRDAILSRGTWTVSFTGSDDAFATLCGLLETWSARRPPTGPAGAPPPFVPFTVPPREALAGPTPVSYCVQVMPAPPLGDPRVPLFRLGVYLARFDYLLPEVRFKGNAYGAGASHDDADCIFYQYSYRDPRIVETLGVFDRLRDYVAAQRWTQIDIDRAIIGSAKEAEKPVRPGEATSQALIRHLRGVTNAMREQRYAATRAATPAAVQEALLHVLDANVARAAVCVVSSRELLAPANASLGAAALQVADILP